MPPMASCPFGFNPLCLRACAAAHFACGTNQHTAAMSGTCEATPGLAAAGLCESVPSSTLAVQCNHVTKDGSRTPRGLAMAHPHHTSSQPPQDTTGTLPPIVAGRLGRIRAHVGAAVMRGCRVGHVSIREWAARASLACRESWRWRGCALGFMAATFQRKQFPRRCAASSRSKFSSLPGSPRCCDRCAVRPAHPSPAGSQQGRTGATLFNRKEKHHG